MNAESKVYPFRDVESFRNRVTGGGVVIREIPLLTSNFPLIEHFNGRFVVQCVEHQTVQGCRNLSEARKVVHKPWIFCKKCAWYMSAHKEKQTND